MMLPSPCPVCGATSLDIICEEYIGDTGTHHRLFYVECPCGHRGPETRTPEDAKEMWNSSVPSRSAREVRPITYSETKPFILGVHYARRMPSIQYAYGLFIDGELRGCVTYGQPASPSLCKGVAGEKNRHNVLELNRLVITDDTKNNASYLVSHSLKMLPPHMFIISYADAEGWGHIGKVYQACSFLYTGMTKSRTDKKSSAGHSRHYKGGETGRQYRTAKHRYITFTGTRTDKRMMRRELVYPVYSEYPRGESSRYDTEHPVPLKGLDL